MYFIVVILAPPFRQVHTGVTERLKNSEVYATDKKDVCRKSF